MFSRDVKSSGNKAHMPLNQTESTFIFIFKIYIIFPVKKILNNSRVRFEINAV